MPTVEFKKSEIQKTTSQSHELQTIDWKLFTPAPVVGVDEVGRGCLAGPVYAAAVSLRSDEYVEMMTDSKLISEKKRPDIASKILEAHWVGVGFATPEEIDKINILQASFLAMRRALAELQSVMKAELGAVLVDGNQRIPGINTKQIPIVKGDLRCSPISAASIVAKVARDRLMVELAEEFPQYGFERHKGYAAPVHRKAIQELGPTRIHRKTFGGVKEFL